jgi:hypothetical protein
MRSPVCTPLAAFFNSCSEDDVMRQAMLLFCLLISPACGGLGETRRNVTIRGKAQELYLYGSPNAVPVILSSGDGGWIGLVTHVAEFLQTKGYYVIGFNSRAYLASFTSGPSTLRPEDVPKDYQVLVNFARQSSAARPVLAGTSEGAGLSVLAATEANVQAAVQGVICLGLPDQNELGWRWEDFTVWITKKPPNEPSFMVEDIIRQVSPVPLAEIHSTHDEFLPLDQAKKMVAMAGEPKRMWVIEAANHRFSSNRLELEQRLLEALAWIRNPK